jgi:hypothetical protein
MTSSEAKDLCTLVRRYSELAAICWNESEESEADGWARIQKGQMHEKWT